MKSSFGSRWARARISRWPIFDSIPVSTKVIFHSSISDESSLSVRPPSVSTKSLLMKRRVGPPPQDLFEEQAE